MIYPTSMNIAGQTIDVKILDNPLYQMHVCPNCKNPYTSEPYRFPVPTGESKICPACGCEHTQPVDNTYVFGQYVVKDNVLKTWHSDKIPDVCGTCFVHETTLRLLHWLRCCIRHLPQVVSTSARRLSL